MISFGCIAGILAGLLGLGGGVIFAPIYAYIFLHFGITTQEAYMHYAIGSSLATMIFTSSMSFNENLKHGRVNSYAFKRIITWVVFFCLIGSIFASFLPSIVLCIFFASLLAFMIYRLIQKIYKRSRISTQNKSQHSDTHISPVSSFFNGMLIGLQGGMLGGGGGIISVPYLTHKGYSIKVASGTSSALTIPIVIIGTLSYIILGYIDHSNIPFSTGFVYWPGVICMAPTSLIFTKIGVKLSTKASSKVLEGILITLMTIIMIKMLILIF